MKTITITRYRGGLLLLCGLMLLLITPQLVQAQGVPTPTLPEAPSTYTTKNGTVIEEGPAPAIRRKRTPRPQDPAVGQRSPKEPHDRDAPSPSLDVPVPEDVPTPIIEAPVPSTDDKATRPAALAKRAPSATVPDEPFVLGLDGVLPDHLREGKVDALTESMHADRFKVPTLGDVATAAQPVDAKRLQGGQQLATVSDVPDDFALEANYPNPFNPQTTIRFAIPEASYVRIQVFDLLGREVAMLVDGTLSAGRHEVVFDATGLASGLYVYRMDAGTFEQHRTMLLMK